jgi:hypothetical protein
MTLQVVVTAVGVVLVAVGIFVFIKEPRGSGGRTKIKLPGIEAELPVASLLPMVLGVGLLVIASQVHVPEGQASSRSGGEPVEPEPGPAPRPRPSPSENLRPGGPTKPASCVGAGTVSLAALKWAPTDCTDQPGAPVRIDGCAEQRALSWLKTALETLRDAKLEGFRDLPAMFELRVADAYGKKDWALRVMSGVEHLYNVGVGYNIKSGAKDGCLSLTRNGKAQSPSACMDKSGEWWQRRGLELCAVAP